jgi:hypothetical protein
MGLKDNHLRLHGPKLFTVIRLDLDDHVYASPWGVFGDTRGGFPLRASGTTDCDTRLLRQMAAL